MVTWPEYERSPVAIAASILGYFGIAWPYPSLKQLDAAFERKPKHVALVIFDGLGMSQLERYLDEKSFLAHALPGFNKLGFSSDDRCGDEQLLFRAASSSARLAWAGRFISRNLAGQLMFFPRVDSVTKQKITGSFNPWQLLAYKTITRYD